MTQTIVLTKGQQQAFSKIETFLKSYDQAFILKGYAGTGKTFLLKYLHGYFIQYGWNVVLLAPTGRATSVLRRTTQKEARTIHSCIYNLDISKSTIEADDGDSTYKLIFRLKQNEDPVNTIYIVDESSMISNTKSEQEHLQFGSSKLLDDLMSFIDVKNTRRKCLFVGDGAQLPPPNANKSVGLSHTYLQEQFQIRAKQYELTEVHRQKAGSHLLTQAHAIREKLKEETYEILPIQSDGKDIIDLEDEGFIDEYTKIWRESIIIAASNSKVHEYNKIVRERLGYVNLQKGERLIITKNSRNDSQIFYNGDFVGVLNVHAKLETKEVKLNENGNIKTVKLSYRDIIVTKRLEDGTPIACRCKILENTLYREERELSKFELRATIVDFVQRHENVKQGSPEFKQLFQEDPYVNALRVRFGYAMTCHKAQGGEWKSVFIDLAFYQSIYSEFYFRWSYTALTRAKEQVFVRNLKKKLYTGDLFAGVVENLKVILNGFDYTIKNVVTHHNYHIMFSIIIENTHFPFVLWYDKKKVISKILIQQDLNNDIQKNLLDKLQVLKKSSLFDLI